MRITRPRRIILGILSGTDDHPDALEIFRRAVAIDESISLSTVYRTMKLMEGMGAIHNRYTQVAEAIEYIASHTRAKRRPAWRRA